MNLQNDSQEQIRKCLHCDLDECINCLAKKGKRNGMPVEMRLKLVSELHERGYSKEQIAHKLGLRASTVYQYYRALGLSRKQPTMSSINVLRLWTEGKTDREIALELNMTDSYVSLLRNAQGLKPNKKRSDK